jgi:26S proteasome regulatory subunit N10
MTLEACMILLDNSNWARNGDYFPTRWDAQIDVAEKLAEQKILSNPESTVGLITMGGTKVDVLLTPAVKDRTKFVSALHDVQLKGKISFSNSLNIAQLTLKHRQNTNQR